MVYQWWRYVINLGVQATSLPSSFLPFPFMDSPGSLDRAHTPTAKYFDASYTVKQPYKIHIDV